MRGRCFTLDGSLSVPETESGDQVLFRLEGG